MDEIVVDRAEIGVAAGEHFQQLLAHAHQRDGAAGRQIEPAEQLLPARLGRRMHLGRGLVIGRIAPGRNRLLHARGIGPEALRQRLEKGDARPGGEFRIAGQDLARQGHAGGLAAPGEQMVAKLDQAFRAGGVGAAPLARADQRPPALGNGLQQLAEKGGVHLGPTATPIRWSGNQVAIPGKIDKMMIPTIIIMT